MTNISAGPRSTIEKILAKASGVNTTRAGDLVVCDVDRVVLIDLQFRAFNGWVRPLAIADPDRVSIIFDHAVPAPSIADANAGVEARAFAAQFGVRDVADVGAHGICHQVIAERGLARPGGLLVCADSHTCAGGAFNCAARGLGPLEVLQILCTGKTWYVVPETVRYELSGRLPEWVSAKDVFLHLAGTYGAVAENRAIEICGPGLAGLSMSARRTLATQGVELFAEFTLMPCDETTEAALAAAGVSDPDPVWADDGAPLAFAAAVDLSGLEPYVSRPDHVVDNAVPVSSLEPTVVQQCFIGSCANGQLEDLEVAAAMLAGRHVAAGVRLIVTPASQAVALAAAQRGITATLLEAGAVVTSSACGACFGYDLGVVGDGEVCLTASTRNFKGRMGSSTAKVLMASPATVAASAVAGRVVDPREVVG
ncbi:MAG: 3-isopropylmalate dehydratase [Acidimicrobiales bacterium]|nr:3-isopropylmalate dehydratase [Acidimicrobiales bacterium]